MKKIPSFKHFLLGAATCGLVGILHSHTALAAPPEGRGMPAEAREVIQSLFADHAKIRRAVTMTEDGYMAVTESDDPKVAGALHKHVTQMAERLESGLQVRRWDPAFAEYVAHYKEMDHQFQKTEKGVRMVVKGRTPLAVRVAQNHAAVISAFAANGPEEHDRRHEPVQK